MLFISPYVIAAHTGAIRFEIADCNSVWSSLFDGQVDAKAPGAGRLVRGVQWSKWFGGKSSGTPEGQIMRLQRKGCAVVACYGHRLKNMIGIGFFLKSLIPLRFCIYCVISVEIVTCSHSVHRICHAGAICRPGRGTFWRGARATR